MDVERTPTYGLDKNFNFLKQNLLSSLFIMSSSLAQLSAAFSVLLAAITHFTLAFFQRNKHSRVTFAGQFLVWLGKVPLGSKLISGGCNKNVLVRIF